MNHRDYLKAYEERVTDRGTERLLREVLRRLVRLELALNLSDPVPVCRDCGAAVDSAGCTRSCSEQAAEHDAERRAPLT